MSGSGGNSGGIWSATQAAWSTVEHLRPIRFSHTVGCYQFLAATVAGGPARRLEHCGSWRGLSQPGPRHPRLCKPGVPVSPSMLPKPQSNCNGLIGWYAAVTLAFTIKLTLRVAASVGATYSFAMLPAGLRPASVPRRGAIPLNRGLLPPVQSSINYVSLRVS